MEIGLVINFFKEKKNDGIFDYLTKELDDQIKSKDVNFILLRDYLEYAKVLNKNVPHIFIEVKEREDKDRLERVKKLFEE